MTAPSETPKTESKLREILSADTAALLDDWITEQQSASSRRRDLQSDAELRDQSTTFLRLLGDALQAQIGEESSAENWRPLRDFLNEISRTRARQGFSPSETATFVFSMKQPLFSRIRRELADFPSRLADETWHVSRLLDDLGLYTMEMFQKGREEVIARQQSEMVELSTPVVQLWEGVLALPLIGTLDSSRTQSVMETLLQRIVETGSQIAILDITGVPTVDTVTAQHLLKTVQATRLMGADCIISGIRPQIAQTIIHLGIDIGDVLTRSSMAGALELALKRRGLCVTARQP